MTVIVNLHNSDNEYALSSYIFSSYKFLPYYFANLSLAVYTCLSIKVFHGSEVFG